MQNAKTFLLRSAAVGALLIGIQVAINYYIDFYGLFRDTSSREISVYSDERTAKYLLAHKYIPDNFQALWIGPSLSANIDTKADSAHNIYNISMMGANITEQRLVAEKVMETGSLDFVIICLHPYLTFDHGLKTAMINPKEYYGAIGSTSLYKAYAIKFIRDNNLMPDKFPRDQFNASGCNNYDFLYRNINVASKIEEEKKTLKIEPIKIDSIGLQELIQLKDELQAKGTKVIGYFHPIPHDLMELNKKNNLDYQNVITDALDITIFDFNAPAYDSFSNDYSNYIDHGHLSAKGQGLLFREIVGKLNEAGVQ